MKRACPSEQEGCPYYQSGCFEDTHHLFFPRRDYRQGIAKEFRELPDNKEQLCRWDHDIRHLEEEPPIKPPIEDMKLALGYLALGEAS